MYKLAFGPKAFIVVSDPVVVRHLLKVRPQRQGHPRARPRASRPAAGDRLPAQDNAFNYDKGVLAEILEPIMGKGLIPADLETWKPRRRAIVPAFHKAYLEAMVAMFGRCTQQAVRKLDDLTERGQVRPAGALPPAWPACACTCLAHVRCCAPTWPPSARPPSGPQLGARPVQPTAPSC